MARKRKKKSPGTDKSSAGGTQSCPLKKKNEEKPCDIVSLEITHGDRSVKCEEPRKRRKGKAPKMPNKIKAILAGQYDCVLETLAPFPVEGKKFARGDADIKVAADYDTSCGLAHKSPCAVKNADGADSKRSPLAANASNVVNLAAKSLPIDKNNRSAKADFIDFFNMVGEDKVKRLEVDFPSCGLRKKGEPNNSLRGLVRVYRAEDYSLSLSFPAVFSFKEAVSKEGLYTDEVETKRTSKGFGDKFTAELKKDAEGKLKSAAFTNKDSFLANKKFEIDCDTGEIEEELSTRLQIKLVRGTRELDASDVIDRFTNGIGGIIQEIIKSIEELKDLTPKVGFSIDFSIELLKGTITGTWGYAPDAKFDSPAYKWVAPQGKLGIQLTVIDLKLELNFGIEITSPSMLNWLGGKAYEVVLKASLEIGAEASIKKDCRLFGAHNEETVETVLATSEVQTSVTPKLVIGASAMGYECKAEGGLETGWDFEFEFLFPLNIRYKSKRRSGILYYSLNYPWKSEASPRSEYQLWPEDEKAPRLILG